MANPLTRTISHQSRNVTPHRLVKKVFQSQTRVDSRPDRLSTRALVVSCSTIVATCVDPPSGRLYGTLPSPNAKPVSRTPGSPRGHSLFLHLPDQPQLVEKIGP